MLGKLQGDTKMIRMKKEEIVQALADAVLHAEWAANDIELANVTYMVR